MKKYDEVIKEFALRIFKNMLAADAELIRDTETVWVNHYADLLYNVLYTDDSIPHMLNLTKELNRLKYDGVVLKLNDKDFVETEDLYIIEDKPQHVPLPFV